MNIKQQVKRVIEYSQNQTGLNVDELMDSWRVAKRRFINAFGGKLIYEFPEKVSFELGSNEKESKIEEFAQFVSYRYNNRELANFILTNRDSFFSNNLERPYEIYNSYGNIVIQAGTKIVKAFKYFVEDKDALTILQNKASAIIQEDKITGTLCLSVHPLDYLSLSENTYNWRSCHALDGEYRSGNLSYMVDDCTLVCYLKSDREEILPRFPSDVPWNSKKWRVLLFIPKNKSMLLLGRQYPFLIQSAPKFITDKLLPKCGIFQQGTTWTDWTSETVENVRVNGETMFLWEKYIPVGGTLKTYDQLINDGVDALNFNDLLRSSCYVPMYCYTIDPPVSSFFSNLDYKSKYGIASTVFTIGGPVSCLKCGRRNIKDSATVLCDSCEETYGTLNDEHFTYCHICGQHVSTNNGIWVDDVFVCDNCMDEVWECEKCGLYILRENAFYESSTGRMLCRYCYYDE